MTISRIYHPYWEWEETYSAMWRAPVNRKQMLKDAIEFTGNRELYGCAMMRVVAEWRHYGDNLGVLLTLLQLVSKASSRLTAVGCIFMMSSMLSVTPYKCPDILLLANVFMGTSYLRDGCTVGCFDDCSCNN